jgi:cell division septum initiation protein DivIVA
MKELSMRDLDRSGATLDQEPRRWSPGSRFADLGDRLARTFGNLDRPKADRPAWESNGEFEYPGVGDTAPLWEQPSPAFPMIRNGYDCAAVEAHIAELERELGELRAAVPAVSAVAAEIERVGEQTSAILRVAHEQAREITHRAQAQADTCLSDAAANAVAIAQDAKRQLRDLDTETDTVWRERARLIEDARNVATALFTLAEEAAERFPEEPDQFSASSGETAAAAALAARAPAAQAPQESSAEEEPRPPDTA